MSLDLYPLIRPFLFRIDPEAAHRLAIRVLRTGCVPRVHPSSDPILRVRCLGMEFPHPIGLAAGLDKQAEAMEGLFRFGFSFLELGGVTPRPQPGNPRPRLFRIPESKALINRFGLNSVGLEVFTARLAAWRRNPQRTHLPVGVNLAKNKDTGDDSADYVEGLTKIGAHADFFTINVSSPNTPGLRGLQERERLTRLLGRVMEAREAYAPHVPVLVKISPDMTEAELDDLAATALASGVQGLVVANTTTARPPEIPPSLAAEAGGLSGPCLFAPSTRVLAGVYTRTGGKLPLIGCGGVSTGAEAYAKIRAGASLVQIYTSFIFEGPWVVERITRELAALAHKDGLSSVADAIGADHR